MFINRIYQSREGLIQKFKVIDDSAEAIFKLNNEVLYLTIKSNSNDELLLEIKDFKRIEDAPPISLVDESFYLIMDNVSTTNNGEKYLKPILDFLESILALVIFIPEVKYNEIDQKTLNLLTREYLPDLSYEIDGKEYMLLQSASNLV
ncbi:hypothetical protein [Paenibacillus lautus]|uniref:hypothetical protein n=1 Tax=Paenibacillus lautus TaxID=1401 RepID=UPI000BBD843B|nr:hypothetical protein [Paenibacillus lautus]PCL92178.1 hypothetical protein CPZ30_15725 [Paenibacillus lautus]VTR42755.1 Uncharacterised protein [Actinobacillus pleuropneumoniae]